MRKLEEGVADATILALAGLNRLGLEGVVTAAVPVEEMLPAVAQGAVGVEIRAGDAAAAELLGPLNHQPTALAATAERAFLARLDGSIRHRFRVSGVPQRVREAAAARRAAGRTRMDSR